MSVAEVDPRPRSRTRGASSAKRHEQSVSLLENDPLWYKDAIIYELHVRAFHDSNGDGIGDFRGLVQKLDYLHDLGVTAIWLLPFYPSPLRDDGYDIADYNAVNPSYGNLRDFKRFLDEAHARGLRVITELVINHTSNEHPWFQRARRSPAGSPNRDFYVWSDTPDKYRDTRIIFQDFETSNWAWDPIARQYYWHRFYSHQPDLNFDNPAVHKAVLKACDFWLEMGVDGMRLDAVPYLFEREGTNCENLPETHEFLRKLRAHVDAKYPNRMFLAEANQWPEDAAEYFGEGDECHMNFHFPLMPRMFMALQQENNFPILDILEQTPEIPDNCQWAVFLRNHDELTLEMVTDEDRDYMYRVYAEDPQARINVGIRRRLAPLLKQRRKVELMNGLLLSLPGTPVIYYGDEIGMGDNIYLGDRNGVRTPMQWSGDRNAGFSEANPQKLFLPVIIDPEYHYEATNVEAQQANSSSLLWWMKRILALRKQHQVFGRGSTEFLRPHNPKVLAFLRAHEDRQVLVVANLSRFSQYVELDLSRFAGTVPVEMFGRTRFPAIGELPYLLTMGPHAFYWFELEAPEATRAELAGELPTIEVTGSWEALLRGRSSGSLARVLPHFLRQRRWFRGKARQIRGVELVEDIPLSPGKVHLVFAQVDYVDGLPETYVIPLSFSSGPAATALEHDRPEVVISRVKVKPGRGKAGRVKEGLLYDAGNDNELAERLLSFLSKRRQARGKNGELSSVPGKSFKALRGTGDLPAQPLGAEQSNTSVVYGDRLIIKLLRLIDEGTHPDVEVTQYLSETRQFAHVPAFAGHIEYRADGSREPAIAMVANQYIENQGDAWKLSLDAVAQAYDRALGMQGAPPPAKGSLLDRAASDVPEVAREVIGGYLGLVELLAERTAEMHRALDGELEDPAFAAEAFSTLHQRSLYQSARSALVQNFDLLSKKLGELDHHTAGLARALLGARPQLTERLRAIVGEKIEANRIRCHGDYHLGQVLFTGNDFLVLDFEGEPTRSLSERRLKSSPLRDVAGMLRSFHYAAACGLRRGDVREEDIAHLEPWADLWHSWVSSTFLGTYLTHAEGSSFLPRARGQLSTLLDFYTIEKCSYELAYELNNRPDWVTIPLLGLRDLLGGAVGK